MVGTLLLRGMLVGILTGLLCFCFLKVYGEPQVDRAIAFESRMDAAKDKAAADAAMAKGVAMPAVEAEPELVSRPTQAGIGLLTGVTVYSAAFGGLFALVFAVVYGRVGVAGPRTTAGLLAAAGFVAVSLVPVLKYPANPPSVGDPETIGMRTALYFALIAISLAAMIGAVMLRRRLLSRFGAWNAALLAAASYLVLMVVVDLALPGVNEVPDAFPAVVLWQFRLASLGAQALMWATIGLAFGALTERAVLTEPQGRSPAPDVTTRLTVLCHAPTGAVRAAAFPRDEPLDDAALRNLADAPLRLAHADRIVASPSLAARQTADALGLSPTIETALRECDYGRWAGRSLADVQREDADGFAAWLSDPRAVPHGGESLVSLIGRVADWLAAMSTGQGRALAVAHASVCRAAIVTTLAAPASAFWRIDVPPLAAVRLSGHAGRWNLVGLAPPARG